MNDIQGMPVSERVEPAGFTVQSVDRALGILDLMVGRPEVSVTEVAQFLNVHKSTAFRLLITLEAHDLVEQSHHRGRYQLGRGLIRLAGAATTKLDVVREARTPSEQLSKSVGETVNLVAFSGTEAFYIDQVPGPRSLQFHYGVGRRMPLHATSNGKVLLAYAAEEIVEEILSQPLEALTALTVVDPPSLRRELQQIRTDGYAVAVDEFEVGLTAIAAPIFDYRGSVDVSLSVSGPSARLAGEAMPDVVAQVLGAAAQISTRLGWSGVPSRAYL